VGSEVERGWVPTEVQRGRHNAGPERPRLAGGYKVSLFCRNEDVICAHIYTPPSIFCHGSLDLIRDRDAPFPPFW
jgi:hypothetical protein